ncbi:CCR4-NOT transcription complex subunit 10, partial [Cucurbita argyrosperma subsp. sororia]
MDARDSSSSAAEDDGVLSVTAALAKDAASLFQSGKYAGCVEVLIQLLQKKEDDPKVLHNIAIAEYLRDGCSNPKKLLEVLNNVKKRTENLAVSSGEQADALNPENKSTSGKGNNVSAHQTAANNANIVYMDEFDASIPTLNIAIVWFNLHEYSKALAVLVPLYQNIEPIDETTALHICFLLLDVGLACRDASLSADVLLYLEKAFGVTSISQSENGSTGVQQSTNVVAKSSSVPTNTSAFESSNSDLSASVNASENSLSRTLSDETFEYESMLSTLDIGGQNPATQTGFSSSNVFLRIPADRSLSTVDFKLKLQLYKVRFLLLTRNLKQAKREAKHAMNIARGIDSSMALLLKAELEYARGNHRKAMKLLLASSNRTDMGISSMLNNNLGCIYNQLGKYHTSTVFFSKAVSNSSALWKDRKQTTFSQDNSLLIVYNCGVQYLACGKPFLAARCFQKASLIFYNRPLLWLRLAECCLMASEKGLLKNNNLADSDRSDIKVHVVGMGRWRQLVLEDKTSKNGCAYSSGREDEHFSIEGQPKLSITLARQCLSNALYLLNRSETSFSHSVLASNSTLEERDHPTEVAASRRYYKNLHCIDSKASAATLGSSQMNANGDTKEQKGATIQELVQNSLSYYEDISRRENVLIKQALLADLAYVELKLGNPLRALTIARSLMELPGCYKVYTFLGHVYAAEALCLLNRPKEAIEYLLYYLSGGTDFKLPFGQENCELFRIDGVADIEGVNGGSTTAANTSSREELHGFKFLRPEEARGVLFANFATVLALQGDLEQAQQFISEALSIIPNSPEATLTAVYIDLAIGKSQEAFSKLKQCSCVRFLPSGLTMRRSS